MEEIVAAKFSQNPEIRDVLLSTAGKRLVEHTERDSYWGDGYDGSGLNKLGLILERVRDSLQAS